MDKYPNQENMPSREEILEALHDDLFDDNNDLSSNDLYTILEFVRYMKYLGGSYHYGN